MFVFEVGGYGYGDGRQTKIKVDNEIEVTTGIRATTSKGNIARNLGKSKLGDTFSRRIKGIESKSVYFESHIMGLLENQVNTNQKIIRQIRIFTKTFDLNVLQTLNFNYTIL